MKKILLLDNYDSFTYNLLHIVKQLGFTDVEVHRNDCIGLDEIERFDKILLSPGPGIPSEAGILLDVIKRYAPTKSILGVCLGEQAIGEAFGARLENLKEVHHGISSVIRVVENDYLFNGLGANAVPMPYRQRMVSRFDIGTTEPNWALGYVFDIVLKGLTIRGSIVGTRLDLQESIDFAAQGKVKATIHTAKLEDINDVFARMRKGQIEGRIVLDLAR